MIKNILKSKIKRTPLETPARKVRHVVNFIKEKVNMVFFYIDHRVQKNERKIMYMITPPPRLDNIGDHAQVIGIKKWLDTYFNSYEVLEVDKDQTTHFIPALKRLTNDDDLIFLHSGGNLNDRSSWSEGARRKVVMHFPENDIVQLPQTIFFNDTPHGRAEREKSKQIYESHGKLTITARDPVSLDYAREYFDVETLIAPDFALMIDANEFADLDTSRSGAMLCLRRDQESDVTDEQKASLESYLSEAGWEITQFDTTLDQPIKKDERTRHLKNTLQQFAENELVITDRFHGMIFSVITETPCIAIDTVDHKISSSSTWFDEIDSVRYTTDMEEIPDLITKLSDGTGERMDMEEKYFKDYAERVNEVTNDV